MAPTQYSKETIGELRTRLAYDILEVLDETEKSKKWGKLKIEMLMKLAPTVMPRVTELSGEGGQPIVIKLEKEIMDKYVNPSTT